MTEDTRSRKWQITINNPVEKGYTNKKLVEILDTMKSVIYYCLSDEIGEQGTYHTHIYIACSNAMRFSTLKKRFDGGHFEMAKGTSEQNRDYVFKTGKWANTEKHTTNIEESHIEHGEMPTERQGQRNDLDDLYDMISSGMSNYEIINSSPQYLLNIEKIDKVRQTIRHEKAKDEWRNLDVTYIWGDTGTGKTRGVMEFYGYSNCYRVTNYKNPFDGYQGEDVVIFEEFRSSLPLSDMLKYLDGYPFQLPCRYNDKQALFTKVYIITNIDIEEQYENIQREYKRDWNSFLRRIHTVVCYLDDKVFTYPMDAYMTGFRYSLATPWEPVEPRIKKPIYRQEALKDM